MTYGVLKRTRHDYVESQSREGKRSAPASRVRGPAGRAALAGGGGASARSGAGVEDDPVPLQVVVVEPDR